MCAIVPLDGGLPSTAHCTRDMVARNMSWRLQGMLSRAKPGPEWRHPLHQHSISESWFWPCLIAKEAAAEGGETGKQSTTLSWVVRELMHILWPHLGTKPPPCSITRPSKTIPFTPPLLLLGWIIPSLLWRTQNQSSAPFHSHTRPSPPVPSWHLAQGHNHLEV